MYLQADRLLAYLFIANCVSFYWNLQLFPAVKLNATEKMVEREKKIIKKNKTGRNREKDKRSRTLYTHKQTSSFSHGFFKGLT